MATVAPFIVQQLMQSPAARQWEAVGIRPHHGVAISLAALHSKESCGIGEYPDLIPLIEWCSKVGFDVLQLLPLNDSGYDPSPYNALSAYALNPVYIGITSLPHFQENKEWKTTIDSLQQQTTRQQVPYQVVYGIKEQLLRQYFAKYFTNIREQPDYAIFVGGQKWVKGYSLFQAMRRRYGNAPWTQWPNEVKNITPDKRALLSQECQDEVNYHTFVQYLCFQQMQQARNAADAKKVLLEGDIPILISGDSAGVWLNQHQFHLDMTAGAPPDMYSAEGQSWGFPIYNWNEIEKDNYNIWRQRLDAAGLLYHMYRLDHVIGFFRIWAIPLGKKSREGFFFPHDSGRWMPQGEKLLRLALEHSSMMPIAEDLGAVSDEIRACLKNLGIPGTKVMRWERYWHAPNQPFIDPKDYQPISMTTVSTHDSETLRLWWHDCAAEAEAYAKEKNWTYNRTLSTQQQHDILQDSHRSGSLFHINPLQEYLDLVPKMTWPDPRDERINVPGTCTPYNWTYRYRPSIEEISSSAALQKVVQDLLKKD